MAEASIQTGAQVRAGKAASAFRTISEVAAEIDVPQHVLRFWESKFAQVKPLKRGGGRRYYRPEDVELLRRIRALLYNDGYTIKGVQKLLRGTKSAPAPASADGAVVEAPVSGLADSQRRSIEAAIQDIVELRDLLRSRPD